MSRSKALAYLDIPEWNSTNFRRSFLGLYNNSILPIKTLHQKKEFF